MPEQQSQFIYDQMIERNDYVTSFYVSDPKQYTSPLLDLQTLFRLLLQPGGDVGDVGSKQFR